jgi:EAL and modified HD-GYP domain-containing signal transduction protein
MDALVRAPLETILPDAPADDEMQEALLRRSGRLGTLLRLADAIELDDRESIRASLSELNLNFAQLKFCINETYDFNNEH